MADPQIYSVPFLTGLARSAHPFFTGVKAQTQRSQNVWASEELRVGRRPGTHSFADLYSLDKITRLFEYSYRPRASRESRTLLALFDGPNGVTGVDVVSSRPIDTTVSGTVNPLGQSRARIYDASLLTGTKKLPHREELHVLDSHDLHVLCSAYCIADNFDRGTYEGDIVLVGYAIEFLIGLAVGPNLWIVPVSGGPDAIYVPKANVQYQDQRKRIWEAKTTTPGDRSTQQWVDGSVMAFAQFGNLLFMTDTSFQYPVRVWSGGYAKASYLTQAPRGKYITSHQGRLWIAGLERNGSEIVGSAAGDPYSWEPTSREDSAVSYSIEQDDRDSVTAIARSYYGDLYVWKHRSTHRISGVISVVQPPQYNTISRSIGCASNGTVCQVGNDLYWMSYSGFHSMEVTNKFGDVETSYLSADISDLFSQINFQASEKFQALYWPRLSMYIVGVATHGSSEMNMLVAYSVVSKRWYTWDVGSFTAIGIGPPIGKEADSLYLCKDNDGAFLLSTMEFSMQQDQDHTVGKDEAQSIPVVLAPGPLFVDDAIRYVRKSVKRIQVYHSSPVDGQATVHYSWDGGEERTVTLEINTHGDRAIGSGWKIGEQYPANNWKSPNQISVSSVPIEGQGHVFEFWIEDNNGGRLPYLHADVEYTVHAAQYSGASRRTQ